MSLGLFVPLTARDRSRGHTGASAAGGSGGHPQRAFALLLSHPSVGKPLRPRPVHLRGSCAQVQPLSDAAQTLRATLCELYQAFQINPQSVLSRPFCGRQCRGKSECASLGFFTGAHHQPRPARYCFPTSGNRYQRDSSAWSLSESDSPHSENRQP